MKCKGGAKRILQLVKLGWNMKMDTRRRRAHMERGDGEYMAVRYRDAVKAGRWFQIHGRH